MVGDGKADVLARTPSVSSGSSPATDEAEVLARVRVEDRLERGGRWQPRVAGTATARPTYMARDTLGQLWLPPGDEPSG